jgi:hypothetical protein
MIGNYGAPGFGAVGIMQYVPDLDSLRIAQYTRDTATLFGFFEETDGPRSGLCPRGLLQRIVK